MSTAILTTQDLRIALIDVLSGAADPSAGGGLAGTIGDFYLRSGTAGAYLKTGAGNTNWKLLKQSFEWYSVKDYGAIGSGAVDDTAAVQAAVNTCATAGGGVVFFPAGTYNVTQITIAGQNNVQLQGCGDSSIIKWSWNAATVAGSMLTITNSSRIRIQRLRFDGSGLSNPAASRLNHLLAIGNAVAGTVQDTSVFNCTFTGMIANSGDGIHVLGTAAALIDTYWIKYCRIDGCSRFGIAIEQGTQYGFINENFLTNCETEIAMVATGAVANTGVEFIGNQIVHTSATVRHAVRIEGDSGTLTTVVTFAENIVIGGFLTTFNIKYPTLDGNIITSGVFASADSTWKIAGNTQMGTFAGNTIARAAGATLGPCASLEPTGGNAPTIMGVGPNQLINDKQSGNFLTLIDVTKIVIRGNTCRSADGGATNYGIDIQALAVNITDIIIGHGNTFTAALGSIAACIRLLVNGTNITDLSIVGNQGTNCDYGIRLEDAGAGSFNGILLLAPNNFNAATGDIQQVGTTQIPRIGFNAGVPSKTGPQCFSGAGTPEATVAASVASVYLRTDGGQATTLYYKETGTGNTGWVAVGGWPVIFGAQDTTAVATVVYLGPGWITTAVPVATAEPQIPITRPGIVRNLRIQANVAGNGAATNTYTVRKNGADTALTTTIGNTATGAATDLTHSFSVVAGDLLSLSCAKSAGVVVGQGYVTGAMEIV